MKPKAMVRTVAANVNAAIVSSNRSTLIVSSPFAAGLRGWFLPWTRFSASSHPLWFSPRIQLFEVYVILRVTAKAGRENPRRFNRKNAVWRVVSSVGCRFEPAF